MRLIIPQNTTKPELPLNFRNLRSKRDPHKLHFKQHVSTSSAWAVTISWHFGEIVRGIYTWGYSLRGNVSGKYSAVCLGKFSGQGEFFTGEYVGELSVLSVWISMQNCKSPHAAVVIRANMVNKWTAFHQLNTTSSDN